MRQLRQQNQHLLCRETMFVAVSQVQTLFVAAILRLNSTATQIVSIQRQACARVSSDSDSVAARPKTSNNKASLKVETIT